MSEQAPNTTQPEADGRAPIVVFGGALSVKQLRGHYEALLESGPEDPTEAEQRFLPTPHSLLRKGDFSEMRKRFEYGVEQVHATTGERVVIAAHSFPGLLAVMIGLDRPDIVAGVECIAGLQDGKKHETPSTFALAASLGFPKEARHLKHDSPRMQEHRERVESEWSENVLLSLIATPMDDFFPLLHGLGVKLPPGQYVDRRIVTPALSLKDVESVLRHVPGALNVETILRRIPGASSLGPRLRQIVGALDTESMLRRIPGVPEDTKLLPIATPTGHIDIPRRRAVIEYTNDFRRRAAANKQPRETGPETGLEPVIVEQDSNALPDLLAA